ncbi:MAG: hypothetical protein ACQERD_00990 [Campylobacterota bacterium]
MKFQVTYTAKNKTYYSDIEALHYNDVLNFFDDIIGAEVKEIRQYVFEDNKKKKFENINRKLSVKMYNEDNISHDIKIPYTKKSISDNELMTLINNTFEVNNKSIKRVQIKSFL